MNAEPTWVLPETVRQSHRTQISRFGGPSGIRDLGMLESALARPQNLWHYGSPSIFEMAAAYAFGIAQNHPFIDGNKRTAFVVSATFLELNGVTLVASEIDAASAFLALAAGELGEADLANWFELNSQPTSG